MGTHNADRQSKTGPNALKGATAVTTAAKTTSGAGTPTVVDLYNDQLPPGGG